jgi:hypothetical protein
MTENTSELYEGKFFYEIVKDDAGQIKLFGPYENIYYCHSTSPKNPDEKEYGFIQVIDGSPVQTYTKDEILVTNRLL